MRALATVRPTSRRRRRTSARSESSSAREIVTISDASALTYHSPRLDAAPPSLGCAWSVPRQPALWCLCHIRATNDSIRRSAAVAHGHSPAVYLDRRYCSSLGGQGDRSSKLVMRFRLPSPALIAPVRVSCISRCSSLRRIRRQGGQPRRWYDPACATTGCLTGFADHFARQAGQCERGIGPSPGSDA
jgi:hypothetical protein